MVRRLDEGAALDGVEALVLSRCSISSITDNDMSVFYSCA